MRRLHHWSGRVCGSSLFVHNPEFPKLLCAHTTKVTSLRLPQWLNFRAKSLTAPFAKALCPGQNPWARVGIASVTSGLAFADDHRVLPKTRLLLFRQDGADQPIVLASQPEGSRGTVGPWLGNAGVGSRLVYAQGWLSQFETYSTAT